MAQENEVELLDLWVSPFGQSENSFGREKGGLWVQGAGSDEQEWAPAEIKPCLQADPGVASR